MIVAKTKYDQVFQNLNNIATSSKISIRIQKMKI